MNLLICALLFVASHACLSFGFIKPQLGKDPSVFESNPVQIEILAPDCATTNITLRYSSANEVFFFDVPPTPYTNSNWVDVCAQGRTGLVTLTLDLPEGYHELALEFIDKETGLPLSGTVPLSKMLIYRGSVSQHNADMPKFLEQMKTKYQNEQKSEAERSVAHAQNANLYKGKALHPKLFQTPVDPSIFAPTFLEALNIGTPAALMSILKRESDLTPLYSFDLFTPEFCKLMLEEVKHFKSVVGNVTVPNSMNNYGVILDEMGLYHVFNEIMVNYLRPLGVVTFPHWEPETLDSHHSFVVEYQLKKDESLDFHMDQSAVTINVCLGSIFEGGNVFFNGIRGHPSERVENIEVEHHIGRALFHVGQHWHGAKKIISGDRTNLIMWLRSANFGKSPTEKLLQSAQKSDLEDVHFRKDEM